VQNDAVRTKIDRAPPQAAGPGPHAISSAHPGYGIDLLDRSAGTGLPSQLKAGVESLSGLPLDDVRVHYDSHKPASIQAQAYTQGSEIHLGPGQERHLPHEAWHVIQQKQGRVTAPLQAKGLRVNVDRGLEREADVMGQRADQLSRAMPMHGTDGMDRPVATMRRPHASRASDIIQGYFVQDFQAVRDGKWRQADDLTVATREGYPNHQLYAKAGKVAAANQKLKAANSGIELVETATKRDFYGIDWWLKTPLEVSSLVKVEAKNKGNNTQGDGMLLYADCGRSNAVVVGDSNRQAVYDKPGGAAASKVPGSPASMKIAIAKAFMEHQSKAEPDVFEWLKITLALDAAKQKELELQPILLEWSNATTETEKKTATTKYFAKLDDVAAKYWAYYNTLPETTRDQVDKNLKINRYAKPDVGQGYTISSGGPSAGKATWNFHWGGVVMTTDDGKDTAVLENYATGNPDEQNKLWTFELYGTEKKGQTFHEQHQGTLQHGKTPTTMAIEKVP